jgi:hypothetical protein
LSIRGHGREVIEAEQPPTPGLAGIEPEQPSTEAEQGGVVFTKTVFVLGAGTGYVLGARAGREQYERIVRLGRELRRQPAVRDAEG